MYSFAGLDELSEHLDENTIEKMHEKLGNYMSSEVNTFVIENNYVDGTWRTEFSLFYSKTFYELKNFTTRVHLISEKVEDISEINQENYMGYIVLRPTPFKESKISKIIVKPTKTLFGASDKEELYLASCEMPVNLGGHAESIKVATFPYYQQDAVVTACAHADMWMLAEYLHRRYEFNEPNMERLILSLAPIHGRVIPTRGLLIEQMCSTLNSLGYNTSISVGTNFNEKREIINHIDSYLESGLPTILCYNRHVVVVVGHTLNNDSKDYIIYDDSGYHLRILLNLNGGDPVPFASRVSSERLIDALFDEDTTVITMNIEYDKLFYPPSSVGEYFRYFINDAIKEGVEIPEDCKRRYILADSKDFKRFCNKNGVAELNDVPLPHYIWLIEIFDNEDVNPTTTLILDASAYKFDFSKVLIASWDENKVITKRPDLGEFDVSTTPKIYSNLNKIK